MQKHPRGSCGARPSADQNEEGIQSEYRGRISDRVAAACPNSEYRGENPTPRAKEGKDRLEHDDESTDALNPPQSSPLSERLNHYVAPGGLTGGGSAASSEPKARSESAAPAG